MVHIAQAEGVDLASAKAVVVGAKGAIGSSLISQLQGLVAAPTEIDKDNVADLPDAVRAADVVFTAANRRGLITADMLTDSSRLVVDAAIISTPNGIVGNVDPAAYEDSRVRCSITPVPGGVGRVNPAMLFVNLQYSLETLSAAA
jgi:5,10-methylene-tetrahydrofolate dehydrogenase/methenyl tetrahydrofolate cyclohydrolase